MDVVRKWDPEALSADGFQPRSPLCHRCGVEASFENPVGVTFRRSWNPLDRSTRNHLDALCARCREWLRTR